MIEKIVRDYLAEKLEAPVFVEEPERQVSRYVLIEKTGSGKTNFIYSATLAIQSYAETMFEAAQLNERIKEAMDGIISLNEICSAALNSDYNYTNTESKKYRYQAVYDLFHY